MKYYSWFELTKHFRWITQLLVMKQLDNTGNMVLCSSKGGAKA